MYVNTEEWFFDCTMLYCRFSAPIIRQKKMTKELGHREKSYPSEEKKKMNDKIIKDTMADSTAIKIKKIIIQYTCNYSN